MTETLTKPLTLAEVKVAAHLLLQEDPALTVARYAHRMPEVTKQLDESIRQTQSGTRTHLDHMVARTECTQSDPLSCSEEDSGCAKLGRVVVFSERFRNYLQSVRNLVCPSKVCMRLTPRE